MPRLKTYYSIRTVKASTMEQAVQRIIDQEFDEVHKLSDVVLTEAQLIKRLQADKQK